MAREILILCDFCNNAKLVGNLHNLIQRGSFWGSRRRALRMGWRRIKGKDLCPACIDEDREEDI